jgi:hypothetical protein
MKILNSIEWDILTSVARGETDLKTIAKAMDRSLNRTSVIVAGLEGKGFLTRRRFGLSYRVTLAENGVADHLRRLVLDGLPLNRYLVDSRIIVLATIADARWVLGAPDLAWLTGLSKSSVSLAIHDALRYGVLKKEGRSYRWGGRMEALRSFLTEYARYDNGRAASCIEKNSSVAWQLGPDFIIATPAGLPRRAAEPTGVTAFSLNDLQIVSTRFYYHITGKPRTLRPEDHAVDNILLEPGNVTHLTYSLVYLKRNGRRTDWHYLDRLCRIYGLGDLGAKMTQYLKHGRGTLTGFPTDDEFREKIALYGD